MVLKKFYGHVISRIAQCHNCDWTKEYNEERILKAARSHAHSKRHLVFVECVKSFRYDFRKVKHS